MSNYITIEKIDEVKTRVYNVTYAQAKEALIQAEGDVLEAIILLEEKNKFEGAKEKAKKVIDDTMMKESFDFKEMGKQVKELLKKSSVIRVIIEKNNKTIINIPLTVGVVGAVWGHIYALIGLSAAVVAKYQIKIQNEDDGTIVNLGELNEEKIELLKNMIVSTAKEVKNVVVEDDKKTKKDEKDITDELFEEDELIDKK